MLHFSKTIQTVLALCALTIPTVLSAQTKNPSDLTSVTGQIIDQSTGKPIARAAVYLKPSESQDITSGSTPTQTGGLTDLDGRLNLKDVIIGSYQVEIIKAGFIKSTITDFMVKAVGTDPINFALTPLPEAEGSDDSNSSFFELEALVVTANEMSKSETQFFDLRRSSSGSTDYLSADDFSKFAVSDISMAVKKLPGVNVVEGKFAVVRGLSDRFNSTLINGLPVPSPDPLRQGVQLDLFPTSIIESVVAHKSFIAYMPGNSSGAAFELATKQFPESKESWLKVGFRFNTNAQDYFLQDPQQSSKDLLVNGQVTRGPFSENQSVQANFIAEEGSPPLSLTLGAGLADSLTINQRKLGYLAVFSYDGSAKTQNDGAFRNWFGTSSRLVPPGFPNYRENRFTEGSLYTGVLAGGGQMDFTRSTASVLMSFLGSVSYDLDQDGLNRISIVGLASQTSDSTVRRLSEGHLPEDGVVESPLFSQNRNIIGVPFGNEEGYYYQDTIDYEERKLNVAQILGEHLIEDFNDLKIDWGLSYALTTSELPRQTETNYLRFSQDIHDNVSPGFGVENGNDGVGAFLQEISRNIEHRQYGGRIDLSYPFEFFSKPNAEIKIGLFSDQANRNVSGFSQVLNASGNASSIRTETPEQLSQSIVDLELPASDPANGFPSEALVDQDIKAGYLSLQIPLLSNLTLTAGARSEHIDLTAQGSATLGGGSLGPSGLSLDNLLGSGRTTIDGTELTNGEIIGFENANDPQGHINESPLLPSIMLKYEPSSHLTIRAGFSKTIARPSFRELSPYFDREAQTGDLVLGNPNLTLVNIRNWDFRTEYVFDNSDLIAISLFRKDIENPIEGALLFNNVGIGFRSFYNNPNTAKIEGFEFEVRKSLTFISSSLENFSIGFNYSRIKASVAIPDFFILSYFHFNVDSEGNITRATGPFVGQDGPDLGIDPSKLPTERRLYDQPEWIANADITYDNSDWGFSATLSIFAQSDVLTSVGVGNPNSNQNFVDQFLSSFNELNLSLSKSLPAVVEGLSLKFAISNLTDSKRSIIYDQDVAYGDTYKRLTYQEGQSYRLALDYKF